MKRLFAIYLLPLLYFLLTYLLLGYYYNTNDDPAIELIVRGLATSTAGAGIGPYLNGLSSLFSVLYKAFPSIPWLGVILYGLLLASLILMHRLLWRYFKGIHRLRYFIPLSLLFFLLTFVDQLVFFNFTRVAFLLAGSSLLSLFHPGLRFWKQCVLISLFITGWLIRPEAALLAASSILLYGLIHLILIRKERRFFLKLVPAIAILLLALQGIPQWLQKDDYRNFKERFSLIANYSAYRYEKDNWIENARDRQLKASLNHYFYADKELFDRSTLERITYSTPFNFSRVEASGWMGFREWVRQLDETAPRLQSYIFPAHGPAYFLLLGLLTILLLNDLFQLKKGISIGLVLQYLFMWLTLLLILYFLKMHDRILSPMLCLCFPVAWHFGYQQGAAWRPYLPVMLLFALFAGHRIPETIRYYREELQIARNYRYWSEKSWQSLEEDFPDTPLIQTISSYYLLVDLDPLGQTVNRPVGSLAMVDGWTSLLPYFYKNMEEKSGREHFTGFFRYMEKEKYLFLADPPNMILIQRHFKTFYGLELRYWPAVLYTPQLDPFGLKLYSFQLE